MTRLVAANDKVAATKIQAENVMSSAIQYYHIHIIRDTKFIAGLPDRAAAAWARKLLALECEMFAIIHTSDEPPGESQNATDCAQRAALAAIRDRIITAATTDVPPNKHARNLARRFTKNGPSDFTYIATPSSTAASQQTLQATS